MKQLFFLLLFPCLALAQYPGNANQKITLGEQTTADGLVWRGIRADTTSKIVPFSDTSAYIILDTVEKTLWLYKAGQVPKWQQVGGSAGGSTFDTTTLNLVSRFGLKLNISDTSSMLTNYYRSGRALGTPLSGVLTNATGLPISTGLTGLGAANRIPYASSTTALTTSSGLTFDGTNFATTGTATAASFIPTSSTIPTNGMYLPSANKLGFSTNGTNKLTILSNGNVGINTTSPAEKLDVNGTIINNAGGVQFPRQFRNDFTPTFERADLMFLSNFTSDNGFRWGTIASSGGSTFQSTKASDSGVKTNISLNPDGGNVGIGTSSPQSGYKLHVVDSVYVGGNVSASAYTTRSDYDLKDEIQHISYGINEVMQMQPVKYTYKSNGSTQLGFIAQDLGVITPEVVSFEDKMSVYYNALIPILTKAIQEQQALIKALEQRIINLENK